MKTISTTLMLMFLAAFSFGQQLIQEALTPTEHNALGDPTTNVIDPDGARQGDWIYQDIYGKPILKEYYENHALKAVYYPVLHSDGTTEWENSTEWSTSPDVTSMMKKALIDGYGQLPSDQQIVVLFNNKGEMTRFAALGIWNKTSAQKAELAIRKFLKNNPLTISDETFILL